MRALLGIALCVICLPQVVLGQTRVGNGLSFQTPLPTYTPPASPKGTPNAVAGYDAAPLPEDDLQRQPAAEASRNGVSPTLFRPRHQYRGEAFTPGSSVDGSEHGNLRPGFGLSLTQPMQ